MHESFLPYHDKSSPLDIYAFFGMNKKTFKMTVGKLFMERKIELTGGRYEGGGVIIYTDN